MDEKLKDTPRLIERAFPLKQTSLDSVHEKNVRHGHISTLHIWPARRPLAACRAALIATLLPDPGTPEKRQELCEKIGGRIVKRTERKKMPDGRTVDREKETTEGGILHWGRETENKADLDWFRQEIRKAYGGRAPKVLDPFAGGGAIPLEAMRLGCKTIAVDINPVAWFILKCTLEYPQRLAGKTHPLPDFILHNEEFMESFYKAHPHGGTGLRACVKTRTSRKRAETISTQEGLFPEAGRDACSTIIEADLAWHVRAWGQWVLQNARRELASYYPTYADFEPIAGKHQFPYERQSSRLVPLREDGSAYINRLNAEFSSEYLQVSQVQNNPRWIAKPTVAYLWARTVTCKNCRALVPLLKTRWLCKKDNKRVLLTLQVKQPVGQASLPGKAIDTSISVSHRHLPHWRLNGATYFVTWRLLSGQTDLTTEERSLVITSLRHFEGTRYQLLAYVVMNDHIHVIVEPLPGHDLSSITHSWKSFTANQLQKKFGRTGSVWQDESFDRIIRDETEFLEKAGYILNNPLKRWPNTKEYEWVSSAGVPACDNKETGRDACPTTCPTEACPAVVFGIETDVPVKGSNPAQRRENDKRAGAGTMSRSGAKCPCCGTIMTGEDMRIEGKAGRLGVVNTAVVVDGQNGKEYRLPTEHELALVGQVSLPAAGKIIDSKAMVTGRDACPTIDEAVQKVFAEIPFGLPTEPIAAGGSRAGGGSAFTAHLYGLDQWRKLFTPRQLLALGTFVKWTRSICPHLMEADYPQEWLDAITAGMAIGVDRIADRQSTVCRWDNGYSKLQGTFTRFALPITWDYCEGNPFSETTGNYAANLEWVAECWEHIAVAGAGAPHASVTNQSAIQDLGSGFDAIVTDPPYYDAIPYSDLMDYFYVWLRRTLHGTIPELGEAFSESAGPKWNRESHDGELIDDSSRHGNDRAASKDAYEDGMARVFQSCHHALNPKGRLVIVFAHKHPDAWETLVSAVIRAGFVVDGSWPIQTEMGNRTRAMGSAALASSVWLVCKKRPEAARPGWDNHVLEDMRHKIGARLREFWDAGIRGPDFVWAATGPAMEAYSAHPVVKKANEPGLMTVTEFLGHVRRIVVDFVVGRVLSGSTGVGSAGVSACDNIETGGDACPTENLDEPTAYYLLHRHDFGLEEAPAGACILYAISCGLSDKELAGTWDLIGFSKGKAATEGEEAAEADADAGTEEGAEDDSGSKVKLKTWAQRNGRSLGYEAPSGRPIPLIDRVHRLMHLWKAGDLHKVDEYIDANGLRRQELFKRLLQSLIELSPHGSEERSLLESLSNHIQAKGGVQQVPLGFVENEG